MAKIENINLLGTTYDIYDDEALHTLPQASANTLGGIKVGSNLAVDGNGVLSADVATSDITALQNTDTGLQSQIDAIVASSDVKDIVGTKADLNNYDTTTLGNNDIIKVLQDESQSGQTTYYRWSTSTSTFTLIGAEGPYYTKSATDTLLNGKADKSTTYTKTEVDTALSSKQDTLTAGTNIAISNNVISATDTTYTAGNGLSLSGTEFSADTTVLATQTDLSSKQNTLTAGSNISISNDTISATDTTYSNFTGTDGTTAGAAGLVPAPATTDAGKYLKADGTWDSVPSPINVVQTAGNSQTDVMSQNAATKLVFQDTDRRFRVVIGDNITTSGDGCIAMGDHASTTGGSIAMGRYSIASESGVFSLEKQNVSPSIVKGYNGSRNMVVRGVYDPQQNNDAATKGYVDTAVAGAAAVEINSQDWSDLWQ